MKFKMPASSLRTSEPTESDLLDSVGESQARGHCNDFYDCNTAYRDRTFTHGRPPLFDEFMASLQPGAKVIDFGCGAGRDLAELKSAGFHCEGIDLSHSLARHTTAVTGVPVRVGDFRSLDSADAKFDGALAVASLLHLSRDGFVSALKDIRRWLRVGGFFLATMKVGDGEFFDDAGRRFTLVRQDEWLDYLQTVGFSLLMKRVTNSDQTVSSSGHRWIATLARIDG